MKILTVNAEKGGVGKTTLTWNLGEYLAKQARILMIDLDEIRNLTNRYDLRVFPYKQTILPIFETKEQKVEIIKVKPNIDLIAGDRGLKDIKQVIATKSGERYFLMSWLGKHLEQLQADYDYILIDTHPDFSVLTDNALAVSDMVLTIAQPSEDAIIAMAVEESHVAGLRDLLKNPMTGESFVHANVVKIGNRLQHNTKESQNFLSVEKDLGNNYLGHLQERSVVGIANSERIPLVEIQADERYQSRSFQRFFEDTFAIFERVKLELSR